MSSVMERDVVQCSADQSVGRSAVETRAGIVQDVRCTSSHDTGTQVGAVCL